MNETTKDETLEGAVGSQPQRTLTAEPRPAPEPTTAEILAEVERRMTQARHSPATERPMSRWIQLVEPGAFWFAAHWLALFNTLAFLYVGLPVLAPILMHWGMEKPARVIHAIYKPLCHQLPQRSFFLFGPQWTYTLPELVELVGLDPQLTPWAAAFIGNSDVGYKVAICQRDTAIYGAVWLSGMTYALLRRRRKVRPLPFWAYLLFGVVPTLLDGGYQLLSYILATIWPSSPISPRETTPFWRVITGMTFGIATVWLSYPLFQETMDELRGSLQRRYGWE